MKRLLADLMKGLISRRDFASRITGLGFGAATAESILDSVPAARAAEARGRFRVAPFSDRTPYEQWVAEEGVPVHTGYHAAEVRRAEVGPWKRVGAAGAFIDLEGAEGTDGAYVLEIGPGASTVPQRYLFEETLYVLEGEGETAVWHERGREQRLRLPRPLFRRARLFRHGRVQGARGRHGGHVRRGREGRRGGARHRAHPGRGAGPAVRGAGPGPQEQERRGRPLRQHHAVPTCRSSRWVPTSGPTASCGPECRATPKRTGR